MGMCYCMCVFYYVARSIFLCCVCCVYVCVRVCVEGKTFNDDEGDCMEFAAEWAPFAEPEYLLAIKKNSNPFCYLVSSKGLCVPLRLPRQTSKHAGARERQDILQGAGENPR